MMTEWRENFKRLEGAYAPATIRGYKADFEAFLQSADTDSATPGLQPYKDPDGRLAVVAVLLDRGSVQPIVQTVWNNLPLEKGSEVSVRGDIDMNHLLPADRRYFTYMGSLTTPPCSEGVLWLVLQQPVTVAFVRECVGGQNVEGLARNCTALAESVAAAHAQVRCPVLAIQGDARLAMRMLLAEFNPGEQRDNSPGAMRTAAVQAQRWPIATVLPHLHRRGARIGIRRQAAPEARERQPRQSWQRCQRPT